MKCLKFYTLMALFVAFGAKAVAQEWEHSHEYFQSGDESIGYNDIYETVSGNIAVSTFQYFKCGYGDFYAPHPFLTMFTADGEQVAEQSFFKEAYYGTRPFTLENDNGELFMMTTYTPDHDNSSFNYFQNYDNPPDDCILGLYKLNDQLNVLENHEHRFKIDTFEWHNAQFNVSPLEFCGALALISPIVDNNQIVGGFVKTHSHKPSNMPLEQDSLFMFRMDFDGNFIDLKGYPLPIFNGGGSQRHFLEVNLLYKADTGYVLYCPFRFIDDGNSYHVVYFDDDLNILNVRPFHKPDPISQTDDVTQGIRIKRSRHNTTYFTAELASNNNKATDYDVRLYEFDDDINGTEPFVPSLQYITRTSNDLDWPCGIDLLDDNTLYFAYTLNRGFWEDLDSWLMIEHLDSAFDTISTVYYDLEGLRIHSVGNAINATRDGGLLLVFHSQNLNNLDQCWTTVTKFPAEAFESISEAHDNGLKVAIAYPNPGKDVLNIRTGLKDARVEVYDMTGKLIHNTEISHSVISINTESWPSGTYIWKVISNGKLAESGKWLKSH